MLAGERWRGQGGEGRDALGARARASKAAGSNRTSRTVMSSFQLSITARMRRKRSPFGNGFAAGLHLKRLASSKSLMTVGSFSNNSPVPHSADFVRMCFRATWRAAVAAPVVVEGGGGGSTAGEGPSPCTMEMSPLEDPQPSWAFFPLCRVGGRCGGARRGVRFFTWSFCSMSARSSYTEKNA